jgi:uncharacterized protein DUF5670
LLYTIAVVLLILWLLALVTSYTLGGFIDVLLVIAIVVIVIQVIQGRRLQRRPGGSRGIRHRRSYRLQIVKTLSIGGIAPALFIGMPAWAPRRSQLPKPDDSRHECGSEHPGCRGAESMSSYAVVQIDGCDIRPKPQFVRQQFDPLHRYCRPQAI